MGSSEARGGGKSVLAICSRRSQRRGRREGHCDLEEGKVS